MALADRHTFQGLTKRPGRMHSVLASGEFWGLVRAAFGDYEPPSPTAEAAVGAARAVMRACAKLYALAAIL
jgi:hypothetical protein